MQRGAAAEKAEAKPQRSTTDDDDANHDAADDDAAAAAETKLASSKVAAKAAAAAAAAAKKTAPALPALVPPEIRDDMDACYGEEADVPIETHVMRAIVMNARGRRRTTVVTGLHVAQVWALPPPPSPSIFICAK